MKKIFSKEKFIEYAGYEAYQRSLKMWDEENWIDDCEGKTVEECEAEGWRIADDWCVEVKDEN